MITIQINAISCYLRAQITWGFDNLVAKSGGQAAACQEAPTWREHDYICRTTVINGECECSPGWQLPGPQHWFVLKHGFGYHYYCHCTFSHPLKLPKSWRSGCVMRRGREILGLCSLRKDRACWEKLVLVGDVVPREAVPDASECFGATSPWETRDLQRTKRQKVPGLGAVWRNVWCVYSVMAV